MNPSHQRVGSTHDERSLQHGEPTDPAPQLHPPQPPHVGLRQPASYEHSSTWMNGSSQAHFGDVYHISQAALTPEAEASQENSHLSLTSWLADNVSSMWQRRTKDSELRNRLGEWAFEARSTTGEWLIPVLSRAAFQQHLHDHEARFKTLIPCTSTFAWAQLLHVFNICPGQGIVVWRRAKPDEDPITCNSISLDLDGQSLCHIINIYVKPGEVDPDETSFFGSIDCGDFTVNLNDKICTVGYEARTGATPYQVTPFYDEQDLMSKYTRSMRYGTSDERLILPDHGQPLQHRAEALLQLTRLPNARPWSRYGGGSIVTRTWLEQASRIKRRITTNGGKDKLLQDGLTRLLCEDVIVLEAAFNLAQRYASSSLEDNAVKQQATFLIQNIVRLMFMYENQAFQIEVSDKSPPFTDGFKRVIKSRIVVAIERLCTEEMEGTWISELSHIVSDVREILYLPSSLDRVKSLTFDTESWLWNSRCRVPG